MQYVCLRDCYVHDRFWREGEVYSLPDDMQKSEKNFRPLDQPAPAPQPEPVDEPDTSKKRSEVEPAAEGVGFGDYLCPKCKVTHKASRGKVHKRHLKLLKPEVKS